MAPSPSASSIQSAANASDKPREKKVRLACVRCRERRIKCDGEVPSCSKCAKAGVPCIDVDGRGTGTVLSRAAVVDTQSRLQYLEDLVRTHLPHIDIETSRPSALPETGEKRTAHTAGIETPTSITQKAKRMALDLGLFSLNTSSSHAHYLGSSSGSFFANLLPNDDKEYTSDVETDVEAVQTSEDGQQSHHDYGDLYKHLHDLLPARHDCDRMIRLFYNYYHADYPILHQPSFTSLVDGLYACAQAPSSSEIQHNGWPADLKVFEYNGTTTIVNGKPAIAIPVRTAATQLMLVLGIAADLQTRKRSFAADPAKFHSSAMSLFQISLAEISVASLQSIVLFVLESFLTANGQSVWVMIQIAMAYAIDLGLQRSTPARSRFPELVAHMRRRTFFCLYSLDRLVSTIQGRPIGFRDDTLDLTMPIMMSIAEGDKSSRRDQELLPYSFARFKWATHISELKHRLYRFMTDTERASIDIPSTQVELNNKLDIWLQNSIPLMENLPEAFRRRMHTKLHIDYQSAIGLLYQPSQLCPNPSSDALNRCFESAKQRIRSYWELYNQKNLSFSWPPTHGIFLSGATMVYCIWSSLEIRLTASVSEIAADLRLCSSLLSLGGEWWPLAQRGRRGFERLADSTVKALSRLQDNDRRQSMPMSFDIPSNDPLAESQWFNVESVLQSFLQNEYQLSDMLDTFEASPSEPWNLLSTIPDQYSMGLNGY